MTDAERFAGRNYLICGASSGLGQAVGELIMARGGTVIAVARREPFASAHDSARTVRVQADLTTEQGVATVIRAAGNAGLGLDGLLVNGGGPAPGRVLELEPDPWHQALDALIVRPVALIRGLQPHFQSGASILFVTSSSVREPIDQLDISNVLRPGVAALANLLSRELAPGVRVNSIAPGRISTDRLIDVDQRQADAAGIKAETHRREVQAQIPLGRYGEPAEFAEAAAFLLSPVSSYITGAALQVDGGLLRGV